ncbi:MAG: 2-dehydropantoate 2-reductase [Deltaproteobacteria bacterium]|nr:2-dehydropantoate 2-reductase [Deltaproteobacteria bacterium]
MKILIVGIGAMGGVLAGKLIHAGQDVTLLTGKEDTTRILLDKGLSVRAPEGDVWVRPKSVFSFAAQLVDEQLHFDSIWLLTKAVELEDLLPKLIHLLDDEGTFVCFQNGMVEQEVAKIVGEERVLSSSLAWGGTLYSTGRVERTSRGATYIGELGGAVTSRVSALAAALEHATPVVQSDNMLGVLWSKLAVNCTITSIGALSGEPLGLLLQSTKVRSIFLEVYREVVDVALAKGVLLESIAAPPMLLYLPKDAGPFRRRAVDFALTAVGFRYRETRASMLQSLERGRKTEIAFLNGYVVEEAKKLQLHVPANARLVSFIEDIEAGRRKLGKETLDEFCR